MKHKNLTFWLLGMLLLSASVIQAQRNVVALGGEGSGSGGTLSYTVGQIDYTTIEGSGGTAHLGVQQPYELFVLGVDDHPGIRIEMTVFPNPTRSKINLILNSPPVQGMFATLYDLTGRVVYQDRLVFNETSIPMESLAAATYILRVSDRNKLLKSFKIIKN